MSEHWEFYPCQMGESTAFISYDHGIGDTIDELPIDTLLKVRIRFQQAGEELPGQDDFPVLTELEEAVREFIEAQEGAYVGRITVDGWRYLYGYVRADPRIVQPFLAALGEAKGYAVEFAIEDDPQKRAYWDDLRPSAVDWRVLMDLKVIEALRDHGDGLRKERPIDHFATFPTPESRQRFRLWAEAEGFRISGETGPSEDADRYGIQLTHTGVPRLPVISAVTIPLMQRVTSLGGDYDGWGTSIVPETK